MSLLAHLKKGKKEEAVKTSTQHFVASKQQSQQNQAASNLNEKSSLLSGRFAQKKVVGESNPNPDAQSPLPVEEQVNTPIIAPMASSSKESYNEVVKVKSHAEATSIQTTNQSGGIGRISKTKSTQKSRSYSGSREISDEEMRKKMGIQPKAESAVVDVYKALGDACAKYGVIPRLYGKHFARIPAVWRGSRDNNISVHLNSGKTTDYGRGEKMEFSELMELLEHEPGEVSLIKTDRNDIFKTVNQNIAIAQRVWSKGISINKPSQESEVVRKYLVEVRGLPENVVMQFANNIMAVKEKNKDTGEIYYMMVTPIYPPRAERSSRIIGIQRVYLDANGQKIPDRTKAMLGTHIAVGYNFDRDKAGGVLLPGDAKRYQGKEVALVEGFETGLAVSAATGMPVYVLYDTAGLKAVDIEYLSKLGITGILIAADNDDPDKHGKVAGLDAVNDLGNRILSQYIIPVRVAMPPRKYTSGKPADWLNVWNADKIACGPLIMSAQEFKMKVDEPMSKIFAKRRP